MKHYPRPADPRAALQAIAITGREAMLERVYERLLDYQDSQDPALLEQLVMDFLATVHNHNTPQYVRSLARERNNRGSGPSLNVNEVLANLPAPR